MSRPKRNCRPTVPTIERERRARLAAPAAIAALRLNAAVTAGENCGNGGEATFAAAADGATAVNRSASLDMAVTPAVLPAGAGADAMLSIMAPLCLIFRQHSQTSAERCFFPSPRLNG